MLTARKATTTAARPRPARPIRSARAKGCGAVLDEAKGHDYSGAPATCTTDQVCARKGCGAVLDSAKGHDYSGAPATCTTDQVCAREGCGAVLDELRATTTARRARDLHDRSGLRARGLRRSAGWSQRS